MSTHQIAQGLAALGRNGDSTLVHMQPREVAGLQALAKAHGGSLTINPQTGLAEASFLGDVFGAVAPIALGAWLGPAGAGIGGGLFDSALTAGLAVGAGAYALTGDPMQGLSAGLGAGGGFGLGKSLMSASTIPGVQEIVKPGMASVAKDAAGNALASSVPGTTGVSAFTSAAPQVAAGTITPVASTINQFGNLAPDFAVNSVNAVGSTAAPAITEAAGQTLIPSATGFEHAMSGLKSIASDPVAAWKAGQIGWKDAATVGLPILGAAMKPPEYKVPEDTSYKMKYEGPYTPQNRAPRMPTAAEQEALNAAGTPEYSYFGDTNPYPGFNKAAGYANGGLTQLYGNADGNVADNTPQDGYGLGRLQQLAQGGATAYAGGGIIAFDNGGQIPSIPQMGAAPAGLAQLPSGISLGGNQPQQPQQAQQPAMPTPQAPVMPQAPSQDPLQTMLHSAITDPMGRVVQKAMGGGIHSLAKGGKTLPGGYLDGEGDGMSDSIPATIEGVQPARLADSEFVLPADIVSHLGNGSSKAGAKHLYKVMDKIRMARTGTKKQGKKIDPNKFISA